jgi:hypothetical protein
MPGLLETKWTSLWKDFETTRKSEWLKSKEVGKFNAMIKEVPEMVKVLKSLDTAHEETLDACGARRGKTHEDVPFMLKSYVTKLKVLMKGDLKKLAQASFDEMDKATKPNTYRALKVLMTGIAEITSLAEYQSKGLANAAAAVGKEQSIQERAAKVQELALTQIKKAVMKSLAGIQKVKAGPTPDSWQLFVANGCTRDVVMGLVSLEKAQTQGSFGNVPAATPHKLTTTPFNTGQPMANVTPDMDGAEITRRLKAWSGMVKAIAADYQAHW